VASASENRADLIPILTGAAAETFVKNAEIAEQNGAVAPLTSPGNAPNY